ncbi:Smr/MutS family protein [Pseudodesulfovibrio senegalensis]|jgi:DNA-nicking Smr family endonuclease|uniref:DNA mismatch repair protein MutS n=1 Tax=Pseudodesulfovibrio senegalensis TaxID=1721087 RepID=A0A6N6N348_9BACT|nr:Smr/MutS family protein [Pseudodesulfovibrio senegalensis]KAB1441098.1 DNA mismatch repair protein MutS [Pseudodesulfovibrio senegalensis]
MGSRKKKQTLEDLKKIKIGSGDDYMDKLMEKAREAKASPAASPDPPKEPHEETDDEETFFNAMQGVQQLEGQRKGREIPTKTTPRKKVPMAEKDESEDLRQFMAGNIDFELEYTDEYMHGYVTGLDSKVFYQLKAGSLSHQAHVDLHGLNSEQARDNLLFFIRECYLQNKRCLLVITGRGKNSPGGRGILRQELQTWLTKDPLRRIVLAFCTAQAKDGGAGAVYVLLRKQKKQKGKVKWDTMMNW